MSSGQRKRGGGPYNSGPPRKRIRQMASTSARASEAEPVELGGSAPEELEDVAGLSSNPAVIDVDLDDSDEVQSERHIYLNLAVKQTDAEAPDEPRYVSSESSKAEPIEIIDLTQDDSDESDDEGPEEPRYLLSESSEAEPVEVIDLTQDDSDESDDEGESNHPQDIVVIFFVYIERAVEENQQEGGNSGPRVQQQSGIAVPARDDPDEPGHNDMPPGAIRCRICMDFYSAIVQSGRHLVATVCGHVFCSRCLYYSLMNGNSCPTCRTDLSDAGYHRLYL